MSTRLIANDALWRCLCPAYRPISSRPRLSSSPTQCIPSNPLRHSRRHSSSATAIAQSSNAGDVFPPSLRSDAVQHSAHRSNRQTRAAPLGRFKKEEQTSLVLFSTGELYERLRVEAAKGNHEEVMNIVRILIKDRRERPNTRLYAGILHSFSSPMAGTAGKIRKVLEEMAGAGLDLDAGACHCVLEALAVHPDYLLRDEILTYMRERWFTLTDRGHNMIVAGLLRDRLFEQAMQKIEDMLSQRIMIADWLLDKAIWIMLDYEEVDEAWQLLQIRQSSGRTSVSQAMWMQFLDVASRRGHVDSVTHIWNTRVSPSYLNPPTGACMLVLSLAARHGLVKLATDVFRVLTARDTILTSHHYEMLLEAYLNADDLRAALSVLLIMSEAGIRVDEASISPLYCYLKQPPASSSSDNATRTALSTEAQEDEKEDSRPLQAFKILQSFTQQSRRIPVAAVNACLSASIQLNDLACAVEMYKALHTICKNGPTTATFNILFQGCHKDGRKELAMFLAEEMSKLGCTPDALTYDRLILVCCMAGVEVGGPLADIQPGNGNGQPTGNETSKGTSTDAESEADGTQSPQFNKERAENNIKDAFLYYEEMCIQGFTARRGTYEILIKAGLSLGDHRTVSVVRDMKEVGFRPSREVERLVGEAFPDVVRGEGEMGSGSGGDTGRAMGVKVLGGEGGYAEGGGGGG